MKRVHHPVVVKSLAGIQFPPGAKFFQLAPGGIGGMGPPEYGEPIGVIEDLEEVELPGRPCRVRLLGADKAPLMDGDEPRFGFVFVDAGDRSAIAQVSFPTWLEWMRGEDRRKHLKRRAQRQEAEGRAPSRGNIRILQDMQAEAVSLRVALSTLRELVARTSSAAQTALWPQLEATETHFGSLCNFTEELRDKMRRGKLNEKPKPRTKPGAKRRTSTPRRPSRPRGRKP